MKTLPLDTILQGDVRELLPTMPSASVDCVITSPPYWALRDYGVDGQLGLEPTWREHMAALLPIFREIHRLLKPGGNLFVNYGDTVATGAGGSKNPGSWRRGGTPDGRAGIQPARSPNRAMKGEHPKHKLGLHYRLRFMLNDELDFISRADIVWHKRNQMPLSVKDRVTPKYEMLFHFVKQPRYWYDLSPIRVPYAESTLGRVAQASFDEQTGGPRDYDAVGMGNTMSARRSLENLRTSIKPFGAPNRGAPPGQKPLAAVRKEKARPSAGSFNIRVRDVADGRALAKWGADVKASEAEVTADLARRAKTNGTDGTPNHPRARLPPEPGEEGAFHPLGANPGDVWDIPAGGFDLQMCDACEAIYDGAEYDVLPAAEATTGEVELMMRDDGKRPKARGPRRCRCGSKKWVSHFATYPEELVRRLIVSGCPAKVCTACGVPWRVHAEEGPERDGEEVAYAAGNDKGTYAGEATLDYEEAGAPDPAENKRGILRSMRRTARFEATPACGCGAPADGGVVLDPFMGSGTTALVAKKNGRHFIGTELNAQYLKIARHRIAPVMVNRLEADA